MKRTASLLLIAFFIAVPTVYAQTPAQPEDKLPWWPTDAQPGPVKDEERGGFWWWPSAPGQVKGPWGNRGYAYVNKIIYDWQSSSTVKNVMVKISDVGFVETEDKPSLMVKRIIRSPKLLFKDKAVEITPEHAVILKKAVASLKRNESASVLIAAHEDASELGTARTQAVEKFFVDQGVAHGRIKVLAPEKFKEAGLSPKQAQEPGTILLIIAEIKEVMIPGPKG